MVDNAVLITIEHATTISKLSHQGHILSGGILSKTTEYILAGNLKATPNAITFKKKKDNFFPQVPSASLGKKLKTQGSKMKNKIHLVLGPLRKHW